jgi:hypothetical protein
MPGGLQKLFPYCSTVKERFPEDGPKLETEGTEQGGSRPTEGGNTAQDAPKRLPASHAKSLHSADMLYSSCQKSARKGNIHSRTVKLEPRDMEEKKWPTLIGLKRGFLAKLSFTLRICACALLQILMLFTRSLSLYKISRYYVRHVPASSSRPPTVTSP